MKAVIHFIYFLQLSSSQTLPQFPKCVIMKLFSLHFCHLCRAAGYEDLCVLCVCRRDSSLVKEEIKAFLGNRRISQAVVAQVTG